MKAAELDKGLRMAVDPSDNESLYYYVHPQQIPVVKAFEKVGQIYERTVNDRVWDWWLNLVTAEPVKDQEINKVIPQLYRTKDSDGKEWLFYNVTMFGKDWKGNRKDFSYMEGLIEGIPVFNYEIEPSTNKVIAGTTQVLEVIKKYSIPFNKQVIDQLAPLFRNPLSCIVIDRTGRKYSCSLEEFKNLEYEELCNLKTGYADYMKNRRGSKVYT